jgi:3-oxoacyl-[acyl-carrier-protein] synthase-3
MLIPHQANLRISQFIQKKFELNDDQVYNNIQKYGNDCSLYTANRSMGKRKIKSDTVVLAAFGSGFTWERYGIIPSYRNMFFIQYNPEVI